MSLISTHNLEALPDPSTLRDILRSMAMLDAILCPEWVDRYYSFNAIWSKSEEMGSMRNGQGDDFFALFNSWGCFLKGFVHDSLAAAEGYKSTELYRGIPSQLASCLREPAFKLDDVTFCIWCSFADSQWVHNAIDLPPGEAPDGSSYLLSMLDGRPETYWQWAELYYERDVALDAVKAIYAGERLNRDLVIALNSCLDVTEIEEDVREIGYPM
jgi:hypothetical protein